VRTAHHEGQQRDDGRNRDNCEGFAIMRSMIAIQSALATCPVSMSFAAHSLNPLEPRQSASPVSVIRGPVLGAR